MTLFRPTIRDAYIVSWVSLLFTVIAFFAGLVVAIVARSAATLGYSLENFVDTLSSMLVLWRFWGGGDGVSSEKLEQREKRASIAIALTFVMLAVAVLSVASIHLSEEQSPSNPSLLIALSVPSLGVFTTLGVIKLWFGSRRNLDSPALRKDGMCSVCGGGLSLAVLIGALLQQTGNGVWWLDSCCAVVISFGLFAVGMRTVVTNVMVGNKFWTYSFWVTPGPSRFNSDDSPCKGCISSGEGSSSSSPPVSNSQVEIHNVM